MRTKCIILISVAILIAGCAKGRLTVPVRLDQLVISHDNGNIDESCLVYSGTTSFPSFTVEHPRERQRLVSSDQGSNDTFCSDLETGDFDNDGLLDIAVGIKGGQGGPGLEGRPGEMQIFTRGAGYSFNNIQRLSMAPGTITGLPARLGDRGSIAVLESSDERTSGLAAGAFQHPLSGQVRDLGSGAVFVFRRSNPQSPTPFTGFPRILDQSPIGNNDEDDGFGFTVIAGDFNNDGNDDIAVTAFNDLTESGRQGSVYIFHAEGPGYNPQYILRHPGPSSLSDLFGYSLAAGDFNGDGREDLAISAPGENNGRGAVFIYEGEPLTLKQRLEAGSGTSSKGFGYALLSSDLNGDGIDDLVVSAPGNDKNVIGLVGVEFPASTIPRRYIGYVSIFTGSSGNAVDLQILQRISSDSSWKQDYFGWSLAVGNYVATPGPELAVSSLDYQEDQEHNMGAVIIYRWQGGPDDRRLEKYSVLQNPDPGAQFGSVLDTIDGPVRSVNDI